MSPVLLNPSRFGSTPAASFATVAAALSPSAWYRWGDAAGTTTSFADSSGNGHTGNISLATGLTFGTTGLVSGDSNTAVTWSGTPNAQVTYGSWMDAPTALSMFAIVKNTQTTGTPQILCRDAQDGTRIWQFRQNAGVFEFVKIAGSVVVSASGVNTADGAIHDVGMTYDGSNIRLYVDGAKVATTSAAGSLGTGNTTLYVGRRRINFGEADYYTGVMDEVLYKAGTVWADSDFAALHAAR